MTQQTLPGHGEACFREGRVVLCNCGPASVVITRSPVDELQQSAGEHMAKLHEQIDGHRADKEYWRSRAVKAERREFFWTVANGAFVGTIILGALNGWWW